MIDSGKITDIFFDLDHTLWDFDKNSALAFHKVFQHHKIELEMDRFLLSYEKINLDYWKLYREDKVTQQELRRGRLTDVFKELNMSFPIESIDGMAVSYIDFLPDNNHLFEGALELLDYLKPRYNLHIITNGFEEVQNKKLLNSQIHSFFKTITNSEMVGVKKPNPKIFQFALDKAGTLAENSLMIGDNLEADILGAKAVGMQTVLFNYKNLAVSYNISVSELGELKEFL